ncbi:MAG: alpha/beta hydrolase [bacterium]|nr:alpha/beta hydrolase [bacterium]
MKTDAYSFISSDGMSIHVNRWLPDSGEPVAVLHIVHGSVEYADRYSNFAEYLTNNKFAVYAGDIRGHGKTAGSEDELSYFSDEKDGWGLAIEDLKKITGDIENEFAGKPVFILGHSMGSILVRDYIAKYAHGLQGAILSGTGGANPALLHSGRILARLAMIFKGRKSGSPALHKLIYGTLNDGVENPSTDYDFLSRDEAVVQNYIDDIFCGYTVTTEYAYELLKGVISAGKMKTFNKTPAGLPIYLFSGELDPAGGKHGVEVNRVFKNYQKAGVCDVSLKRYPRARHEMLNEINREEVYGDILSWLNERV